MNSRDLWLWRPRKKLSVARMTIFQMTVGPTTMGQKVMEISMSLKHRRPPITARIWVIWLVNLHKLQVNKKKLRSPRKFPRKPQRKMILTAMRRAKKKHPRSDQARINPPPMSPSLKLKSSWKRRKRLRSKSIKITGTSSLFSCTQKPRQKNTT